MDGVVKAKVTKLWQEPSCKMVSVEHVPDLKPPNIVEEHALVRMVLERLTAIAASETPYLRPGQLSPGH